MSSVRKSLKSERHHWWPKCVSRHWADADGTVGWLRPDGTIIRVPHARLGVIGNAHHIKLGREGRSSPFDQSFERVFDRADCGFPTLISWLESLERKSFEGMKKFRDRFIPHYGDDEKLRLMTECAVSLAVRGPRNREASVAAAEHFRGVLPVAERNALIGLNMRNSHRTIADSIGARAKFVAVYSRDSEFVFGDGFFHNVTNIQMMPHSPKMFVPITPGISVVVCRPSRYLAEPRLSTIVLNRREVDICNQAVQVYSRSAIFFRSERPELNQAFARSEHLEYAHPGNPLDSFIHCIPGVPPRDTSFDDFFES